MALLTPTRTRPGLATLAAAIRREVERRADWSETAALVAGAVRRQLPTTDLLTPDERAGDPSTFRSHLLHVEPDGLFSITAVVWRPGQVTPIHDHVTWCVVGVLQGTEREELFACPTGDCLVRSGTAQNAEGVVTGFAPPGDIHRVSNTTDRTTISLHVYGTDISRVGSSVRRTYDLPVR
jgi:3-mercaptopropionate dioxygenase